MKRHYFSSLMIYVTAFAVICCSGFAKDNLQETVVSLHAGDDAISADFCIGSPQVKNARMVVELSDKKKLTFRFRIDADRYRGKVKKNGKLVNGTVKMPDSVINILGLVRYYSRPRLQRYTDKQRKQKLEHWEQYPAASKRCLNVTLHQDAKGIGIYLDGQYVGRRDMVSKLRSLAFYLPESGYVRNQKSFQYYRNPEFLPLNQKYIAKPGVMKHAVLSLKPGLQTINSVPIDVTVGADNVYVGVVKQMKGSWALECDEHLARTALDGMPETAHFAVPVDYYSRAYALCAVEPDKQKDPIITARLTRFARSGRAEAISDTTMILPSGNEKPGKGIVKVGTVRYEKDSKPIELPLYLVEFKLKPGEIIDLLARQKDSQASMTSQPYLDFEFLGKLGRISAQWDSRHKPDKKSTSGVHVFGVTLKRSPVELTVKNGQPGNIFHNDEKPEMTVTLKATRKSNVEFSWRIYNVKGETVANEKETLSFQAAEDQKEYVIPLKRKTPGWYGIDFVIKDSSGRELINHQAAFALLGNDTRKAGYDSPYGTWWFAGAHYGVGDKNIAGPMLFKAGLRKTTFGWTKNTEKDMKPWKLTLNQIGWKFRNRDLNDFDNACKRAEKAIRESLEKFPHCKSIDIFHESYRNNVPPELRDAEFKSKDPKRIEKDKKMTELATKVATFIRKTFPQLKMVYGNTSASASIMAMLMRNSFNPDLIDYIGIESPGQTCMPEKLWEGGTQGTWLAREVCRKFGHELPVTGCYEFTARTDRTLGAQRQAEWIVRDMLIGLAYKFDHISPAILHDAGNAYFNTLWGAGGLCRRNPLLYPKPAYVAVATLTKVLDQVKLIKRVETGSNTVYALEFKRSDGKFVYVMWTTRGEAEMRFQFQKSAGVDLVGFYGESTKTSTSWWHKRVDVSCSPAPVYLVSPEPVNGVTIVDRTLGQQPPAFQIANKMESIDEWVLHNGNQALVNPDGKSLPLRKVGHFKLSQVDDDEMGPCLQLKLLKKGTCPDIVSEYTVMKLKHAALVDGKPKSIGLMVKGDSGWGKIIFEIQDATGVLWRTEGAWHDWPGDLSICHSGWHFMSFPIGNDSSVMNISPGSRWNGNSPDRFAKIQFPIKIVGLYVVMNRNALDLNKMKDVKGVLRFRNIGTTEKGVK